MVIPSGFERSIMVWDITQRPRVELHMAFHSIGIGFQSPLQI